MPRRHEQCRKHRPRGSQMHQKTIKLKLDCFGRPLGRHLPPKTRKSEPPSIWVGFVCAPWPIVGVILDPVGSKRLPKASKMGPKSENRWQTQCTNRCRTKIEKSMTNVMQNHSSKNRCQHVAKLIKHGTYHSTSVQNGS